ncbi:cytochrome c family protein [Rhodobacter sp. Har01]|uniref:c-type cytochrome n=1 Tax=Rhodobacter sp. Har01 TaxID=2883999 RepID=UPI001D06BA12|nr:cytochrome c family protein [Rhodobacter sp. Har01]MCB6179556.1 cytochrome c family protein [Rhodobacter sp. Har01]
MFDTMTITKVVGGTCGSLLAFLLIGWASDGIYGVPETHHAAAEAPVEANSTAAEATEAPAEAAPDAAEAGADFAGLFAAADPAAGEKVFGKCKACHKIDGKNGTGPHLDGVVDRPKASVEGFGYSAGLLAMAGDSWTPENLNAFLTSPKDYVAKTKMAFAGLPKPQDRANVIAYLASLN